MPHRLFSRLATVRLPVASILALALGLAAAVALASCGGEDAKLLPGNTAQEITENLDSVQRYAEEGECIGAEDAVAEVNTQIESLEGIDPELEEVLQRGAARLSEVVGECEETTTETLAPDEEKETTTEETEPPGQEKKEEKEREKEAKELEKEEEKQEHEEEKTADETTGEEPPAPPEPPAGKDGGTGAPGGVSPGAPAEPEGE